MLTERCELTLQSCSNRGICGDGSRMSGTGWLRSHNRLATTFLEMSSAANRSKSAGVPSPYMPSSSLPTL
jgi:hypothetical protein